MLGDDRFISILDHFYVIGAPVPLYGRKLRITAAKEEDKHNGGGDAPDGGAAGSRSGGW